MGRLPTFLVIGAMKAGTTSLYGHLLDHPHVFMPDNKEPDFFVAEKTWGRGIDWYRRLFDDAGDAIAVGEASTSYSKCTEFAGVPERIASVVPGVRLVYLVREPVERIRSMYLHNVIRGRERRPIRTAVLEDPMYVGASSYALQLRAYAPYVPLEQILVVTTEDLQADAAAVMTRVYGHIGVDPAASKVDPRKQSYRSSDRRADSPARTALRRVPGWEWAARSLPGPLVQRLKSVGTTEVDPTITELAPDVEDALRHRLAPDVKEFRRITGLSAEAWGW